VRERELVGERNREREIEERERKYNAVRAVLKAAEGGTRENEEITTRAHARESGCVGEREGGKERESE